LFLQLRAILIIVSREYFIKESGRIQGLICDGTGTHLRAEPLLAGVEKLIDQVPFDSNIPRQHELYEPAGEAMLLVKHLAF
jgi:hypothetical protein